MLEQAAGFNCVVGSTTRERVVALTFDDGPNPESTPLVLETLARHGASATFFALGRRVQAHPELVRQIAAAGHVVANHTVTHPRLVNMPFAAVMRELRSGERALRGALGRSRHPGIMRPPFGAMDKRASLVARALGYTVVNWSASGDDWQGEPAQVIAGRVLERVQPGGIVLLHDSLEPPAGQAEWRADQAAVRDRGPTIAALGQILTALQARGFRFVTVPALMRLAPVANANWLS
jgi:peptidoglycan/xylan/chitin deacetylase (PgdA/CDA1 family)